MLRKWPLLAVWLFASVSVSAARFGGPDLGPSEEETDVLDDLSEQILTTMVRQFVPYLEKIAQETSGLSRKISKIEDELEKLSKKVASGFKSLDAKIEGKPREMEVDEIPAPIKLGGEGPSYGPGARPQPRQPKKPATRPYEAPPKPMDLTGPRAGLQVPSVRPGPVAPGPARGEAAPPWMKEKKAPTDAIARPMPSREEGPKEDQPPAGSGMTRPTPHPGAPAFGESAGGVPGERGPGRPPGMVPPGPEAEPGRKTLGIPTGQARQKGPATDRPVPLPDAAAEKVASKAGGDKPTGPAGMPKPPTPLKVGGAK